MANLLYALLDLLFGLTCVVRTNAPRTSESSVLAAVVLAVVLITVGVVIYVKNPEPAVTKIVTVFTV